jgi:hypothetical protein
LGLEECRSVCPKDIKELQAAVPRLAVIRAENYIMGALSKELRETVYEMGIITMYRRKIMCGYMLGQELSCQKPNCNCRRVEKRAYMLGGKMERNG